MVKRVEEKVGREGVSEEKGKIGVRPRHPCDDVNPQRMRT